MVCLVDSTHEMPSLIYSEKKKPIKMSPAEAVISTLRIKCLCQGKICVWDIYGGCLQGMCSVSEAYGECVFQYMWKVSLRHMYSVSEANVVGVLRHMWSVSEAHVECLWGIYGVCLRHMWSVPLRHLQTLSLGHIWSVSLRRMWCFWDICWHCLWGIYGVWLCGICGECL